MKRVRCDHCGQESPFFEAGTPCTTTLTDGVECPGTYRDPEAPEAPEVKPSAGPAPVDVEDGPPPIPSEAPTTTGKKKIAQHSSKSQEHFTPPPIVEVSRKVMGRIDLDPASCEKANTIVKAQRFYTKADDGLSRGWDGFVFCNPPGGFVPGTNNSQSQAFFFKAVKEWNAGNVKAVCFLGFTLEILRLTQAGPGFPGKSACDFAFCILKERADFLVENACPICGRRSVSCGEPCVGKKCKGITVNDGQLLPGQPTHANVLILISTDKAMIRKFYTEAQSLGAVVVNADLVL